MDFRQIGIGVLIVALGAATTATADTIRVTSGAIGFDSGDPFTFVLRGDGLHAVGSGDWGVNNPGGRCLDGCPIGEPVSLDALFRSPNELTDGFLIGADGSMTAVFYGGELRFTAGSAVPEGQGWITAPFTMSGRLTAYLDESRTGTPLLDHTLTGAGNLAFLLTNYPGSATLVRTELMYYDFQDTAPTPEPASLLLMGSGLALVARRARLGRRRENVNG